MAIGRWRGAIELDERRSREQGRRSRVGPLPDATRRRGGCAREELVAEEAGIAAAAVRVEDPEAGPATGRPVPVARDRHVAVLADDVPAQPDPASPPELEPQPARLLHRRGQPSPQAAGLEDHEERAGSPGQRREASEPVAHRPARDRGITAVGQVDHEEIDGPGGQERRRDRERLVEVGGGEHHEPLGPDAASNRFDGVERAGEIQPRDDRARGLGLGGDPQCEGRLARAGIALQRDRRRPGQAARREDGVERGEPGGHDPAIAAGLRIRAGPNGGSGRGKAGGSHGRPALFGIDLRPRGPGERALDDELAIPA